MIFANIKHSIYQPEKCLLKLKFRRIKVYIIFVKFVDFIRFKSAYTDFKKLNYFKNLLVIFKQFF